MKLAEALAQRADAQKRFEQLRARAKESARYQEGEPPVENAAELLEEARHVADEVERLVRQINATNAVTELAPGVTITSAIARRDALSARRTLLTDVADAASGSGRSGGGYARQLRSELRWVTDLPVAELRREADRIAQEYRQLDVELQAANWQTELIE